MLNLAYDLTFKDLYALEGLHKIDQFFLSELKDSAPELATILLEARQDPASYFSHSSALGNFLVEVAPYLEDFLGRLFGIKNEVLELQKAHASLSPLATCKRLFVQRIALKKHTQTDPQLLSPLPFQQLGLEESELTFATHVLTWLQEEETYQAELEAAALYAAWAVLTPAGQEHSQESVLFKVPRKLAPLNLVPVHLLENPHPDYPQGFSLRDQGYNRAQALDQANYCIWCHKQNKDSCSKGLKDKTSNQFSINTLGSTLHGCPLEQKISEMNQLKAQGNSVAALAVVTIDNPLVAATGHRICNDCMKACIYQKQDPVNIPSTESQVLKEVLNLPWGFEIYSLLTRWNPLNLGQPLPQAPSEYKILVAGQGPAGFTLSHYLLQAGHIVVAIDGLKTELLQIPFIPIHNITALQQDLSTRSPQGFGGVAEYGITVRWDKNNLTLIRLLLERRQAFSLIGGVRYGGTLKASQALELGFDHIALCLGAGRPRGLQIPGNLAKGVRQASDFLMALQLTGAAQKGSIANLQLRLPIVVIGGGLTAIDTATEALAYYPVQVEKFAQRYEALVRKLGTTIVEEQWSKEDREIAQEFLEHADLFRQGKVPETYTSTLLYRRKLQDSPAYRLNHEEVIKAFAEGVRFAGEAIPLKIETDAYGAAIGIQTLIQGTETFVPSRAILLATGTEPNTILSRSDEEEGLYPLDQTTGYFQAHLLSGEKVTPIRLPKQIEPPVLLQDSISFFGDLHPSYAGNVVKAMASAKQGYPIINHTLKKSLPRNHQTTEDFLKTITQKLTATVYEVNRLTSTIVEVVVHAPLAAENFKPGQFYRLQNYSTTSSLAMEGLALTGANHDPEKGIVSLVVLEMGGSSNLCIHLVPGEKVVLMGPTGTATEIPENKTLLLAGGGLGNAVLFSIGQAARHKGCKVVYFAGYKHERDVFKKHELEAAADQIIWCADQGSIAPRRPQDQFYSGNIVEAMVAYGAGALRKPMLCPLEEVEVMIVIGSSRMMYAIQQARHTLLKEYLSPNIQTIASVNSPMQCMMKEICGQCIQRHVDPLTQEEKFVFSCTNQDQPLDQVDFTCLENRLGQNSLVEKLTTLWVQETNTNYPL